MNSNTNVPATLHFNDENHYDHDNGVNKRRKIDENRSITSDLFSSAPNFNNVSLTSELYGTDTPMTIVADDMTPTTTPTTAISNTKGTSKNAASKKSKKTSRKRQKAINVSSTINDVSEFKSNPYAVKAQDCYMNWYDSGMPHWSYRLRLTHITEFCNLIKSVVPVAERLYLHFTKDTLFVHACAGPGSTKGIATISRQLCDEYEVRGEEDVVVVEGTKFLNDLLAFPSVHKASFMTLMGDQNQMQIAGVSETFHSLHVAEIPAIKASEEDLMANMSTFDLEFQYHFQLNCEYLNKIISKCHDKEFIELEYNSQLGVFTIRYNVDDNSSTKKRSEIPTKPYRKSLLDEDTMEEVQDDEMMNSDVSMNVSAAALTSDLKKALKSHTLQDFIRLYFGDNLIVAQYVIDADPTATYQTKVDFYIPLRANERS